MISKGSARLGIESRGYPLGGAAKESQWSALMSAAKAVHGEAWRRVA